MAEQANDRYWSVDIPGLTEEEARRLLQLVETQAMGWHSKGSANDPGKWLTLHLDRDSAQMIYDGLMSNPATAPERGLAGIVREWLASASDDE